MKTGNIKALSSIDSIFTVLKVLNLSKRYLKNQEASYNFKLGFALSNRPHFNSVYLVKVPFLTDIAVCTTLNSSSFYPFSCNKTSLSKLVELASKFVYSMKHVKKRLKCFNYALLENITQESLAFLYTDQCSNSENCGVLEDFAAYLNEKFECLNSKFFEN